MIRCPECNFVINCDCGDLICKNCGLVLDSIQMFENSYSDFQRTSPDTLGTTFIPNSNTFRRLKRLQNKIKPRNQQYSQFLKQICPAQHFNILNRTLYLYKKTVDVYNVSPSKTHYYIILGSLYCVLRTEAPLLINQIFIPALKARNYAIKSVLNTIQTYNKTLLNNFPRKSVLERVDELKVPVLDNTIYNIQNVSSNEKAIYRRKVLTVFNILLEQIKNRILEHSYNPKRLCYSLLYISNLHANLPFSLNQTNFAKSAGITTQFLRDGINVIKQMLEVNVNER